MHKLLFQQTKDYNWELQNYLINVLSLIPRSHYDILRNSYILVHEN
jgi:hypothetical protein